MRKKKYLLALDTEVNCVSSGRSYRVASALRKLASRLGEDSELTVRFFRHAGFNVAEVMKSLAVSSGCIVYTNLDDVRPRSDAERFSELMSSCYQRDGLAGWALLSSHHEDYGKFQDRRSTWDRRTVITVEPEGMGTFSDTSSSLSMVHTLLTRGPSASLQESNAESIYNRTLAKDISRRKAAGEPPLYEEEEPKRMPRTRSISMELQEEEILEALTKHLESEYPDLKNLKLEVREEKVGYRDESTELRYKVFFQTDAP